MGELPLTTDGERRLMANVFGGGRVNCVFRDIGRVIAHPFEMAMNIKFK